MTRFIDAHRERFGVTPICDTLGWNVSTYYAYKSRPPSDRALRDEWLRGKIRRLYDDDYKVYGARKVWIELRREGTEVARCTVERLMREMGLQCARRGGTKKITTTPDDAAATAPADLVERDFTAERPDR
jgi:putative transposase